MTDDRDKDVTAPPGASWISDWDPQFHDRVFGAEPFTVARVAAMLTGIQHRGGSTISGVALRVEGTAVVADQSGAVATDLTPSEARELAAVLLALADRAEALDGRNHIGTMGP